MGGSSKSQTVGYKYYMGVHHALCHAPADLITRIRVDDKAAWVGNNSGGRITVDAPELFGGESREGGVAGEIDFLTGLPSQAPNDYLISQLGTDIPAYRGVVTAILRKMYIGNNPYLKNFSWRIQRIFQRANGREQWLKGIAAITNGSISTSYDAFWKYKVVEANQGGAPGLPANYMREDYDDSDWLVGRGGFGSGGPGAGIDVGTYVPPSVRRGIWLRKKFVVPNPSQIPPLQLMLYHDDGCWLWWNGEPIAVTPSTYFWSTAVIPTAKIKEVNTLAFQVLDSYPDGSPSNIFAGVTILAEEVEVLDMNPAHIIRECLTDSEWGLGYNEEDIDDASFTSAANKLYEEGMGMSLLWDKQTTLEEFISDVLRHIDGSCPVDRKTGKFKLKLVRDDYNKAALTLFNEDNIDKIEGFGRPTLSELINTVTVGYYDNINCIDATETVQNLAMQHMQGCTISTKIQYQGFTNAFNASRAAHRDLRAYCAQLFSGSFYTKSSLAKNLEQGDVARLSWAAFGLDDVVIRITQVAYGDGKTNKIKITFVEDVFNTPSVDIPTATPPLWDDPNKPPEVIQNCGAIEAPYFELVQRLGQAETDSQLQHVPERSFLQVFAERSKYSINADAYADSGAGYENMATLDFCAYGALATGVGRLDTSVVLTNISNASLIIIGEYAIIGDEIVLVEGFDLATGVLQIGRGLLDTLPLEHEASTGVFFADTYSNSTSFEYLEGESVDVKVVPKASSYAGNIDSAIPLNVDMVGRAYRPYPPGNLKVNGQYWPADFDLTIVSFTWAHRDRTQQTAGTHIVFQDGNVGPEIGVTYVVRVIAKVTSGPDVVAFSVDVGTATSYDLDFSTISYPPMAYAITIEVLSIRGGVESMLSYKFERNLLQSPTNVDAIFIEP